MRKLHLPCMPRRTVISSFWMGALQLPWQHYTHPLSCWVWHCLQWQHRCWSWAAWWLSGNVATERWHSFSKDFKHGKAPDWTKRKPSWLLDTSRDFLRATLQLEMSGNSDCISEHQSKFWCHTSLCSGACFWLYHSAFSFLLFSQLPYIRPTLFLSVQVSSSSYGFRTKPVHLHRYHRHFGKPVACIQMSLCYFKFIGNVLSSVTIYWIMNFGQANSTWTLSDLCDVLSFLSPWLFYVILWAVHIYTYNDLQLYTGFRRQTQSR